MDKCRCAICGKTPNKIIEYRIGAMEKNITPEQFVIKNEGTYNPEENVFYCTECYIQIGMPLGKAHRR